MSRCRNLSLEVVGHKPYAAPIKSPQPAPLEPAVTMLINSLAGVLVQLVVMLDDYHVSANRIAITACLLTICVATCSNTCSNRYLNYIDGQASGKLLRARQEMAVQAATAELL